MRARLDALCDAATAIGFRPPFPALLRGNEQNSIGSWALFQAFGIRWMRLVAFAAQHMLLPDEHPELAPAILRALRRHSIVWLTQVLSKKGAQPDSLNAWKQEQASVATSHSCGQTGV